ncbi:hypothetical protein ILUMI_20482 [Ignelater luminosus]|uniref:Uncharacterized protein n=1 Tax=Ignelater luminosus TaxID=2038154 RepID=A0A8K0CGC0_IGNLU|nr:hypothetical protein ILUMI_20482 [Ignelater luminosus]
MDLDLQIQWTSEDVIMRADCDRRSQTFFMVAGQLHGRVKNLYKIAQNKTPGKSSSVPDISPGKALDLVLPVPVITLAAKRTRRHIAGVLGRPPSLSKSEEVVLDNSKEEERLGDYENECVGCGEDFRKTKKKDD